MVTMTKQVEMKCSTCGDSIAIGVEEAGKCGLCGEITHDCCLDDHIDEIHPGTREFGSIDKERNFQPVEFDK